MSDSGGQAERVYIRDAAQILKRRMTTLRKWESLGVLPQHLRPHRGERNWRYWTPEQIEGIQNWMQETDRRPGKGLPHYNPTEAELDRVLLRMRRPRSQPVEEKEEEDWRSQPGRPPNEPVVKRPDKGNLPEVSSRDIEAAIEEEEDHGEATSE